MIDPTDRADWLTEAQPVAERVAAALSGLTFKRHIYAALKKLGFKPFTKKAEGTSAGIRPRVLGDFVVKSMYVAEEYDAKFCLPTLILGCNGFEPLPDGGKVSEQNIVFNRSVIMTCAALLLYGGAITLPAMNSTTSSRPCRTISAFGKGRLVYWTGSGRDLRSAMMRSRSRSDSRLQFWISVRDRLQPRQTPRTNLHFLTHGDCIFGLYTEKLGLSV